MDEEEIWEELDDGLFDLLDEDRGLITDALKQCPDTIARKVLDNCTFVVCGRGNPGLCHEKCDFKPWVIFLDSDYRRLPRKKAIGVVLHEVAHCVLKHRKVDTKTLKKTIGGTLHKQLVNIPKPRKHCLKMEVDAWKLAAKWMKSKISEVK